jgi:hypothetical protein
MDNIVLSWLLSSLTVDHQATIHEHGGTTSQVWLAIEDRFLDTQFRNLVQGTSPSTTTVIG